MFILLLCNAIIHTSSYIWYRRSTDETGFTALFSRANRVREFPHFEHSVLSLISVLLLIRIVDPNRRTDYTSTIKMCMYSSSTPAHLAYRGRQK